MKKLLALTILMLLVVACGSPTLTAKQDQQELYQTIVAEPTVEVPTAIPSTATRMPTATIVPTKTTEPISLDDIHLELIVVEKRCYGSAGCTITVIPDLQFYNVGRITEGEYHVGPPSFETTYMLIYEIYGGEDGTLTYNLTISPDGTYSYREASISTAHKNDELTVKAVKLIEEL